MDGLWLRIRRGECFGLLGVNGAGKTTTLQLLTGLELPDAGDALVGGASVTRELRKARHGMLLWVGCVCLCVCGGVEDGMGQCTTTRSRPAGHDACSVWAAGGTLAH